MKEIIYYRFKIGFWAWVWLLFDLATLVFLFQCLYFYVLDFYIWQTLALIIIIAAHLGVWLYKYAADNEMAVITDKSIKIDHTNPIDWKDIAYAEEKIVRCFGKNRKVISLVPHDGIDYKYNWLQLHNCGFTAFSIPLYGIISKDDEDKIIGIINKKVGIKATKAVEKTTDKAEEKGLGKKNSVKKTGTKKSGNTKNSKKTKK